MAKSILPIVALGAAALFLMKKKDSSASGTTKSESDNGSTESESDNGGSAGVSVITEAGLYDMKIGETVTLVVPERFFYREADVFIDGSKDIDPNANGKDYILTSNPALGSQYAVGAKTKMTFRPLRKGVFEILARQFDGVWAHGAPFIEYTFSVT